MAGSGLDEKTCIEASFFENALVMIAVLEGAGKIVAWNRAAESVTGYDSGEVVGNSTVWKNLYPDPDYRREITKKFVDILAKKKYFENLETTIRTKSGESRVILWNTKEVTLGGSTRIISVGIDVTSQRQLDSFRESIIDNAYILLAVLGPGGKVLVWNKAAESITGYLRDEVVGKRDIWKKIYPDAEYRKTITRHIIDIISRKSYFENLETTIRTKSGEERILSWNTRRIGSYAEAHEIAIGRDITEQRMAEDALIAYVSEMAMRLRQPMEIVSESLHEVAGFVREGRLTQDEIVMVLEAQARNAGQIAANVSGFQKAIADKNRDIPEAYRKFLKG